jgi:predicted ribosome quality control (RQC) complex YloA/Tae2 family protein
LILAQYSRIPDRVTERAMGISTLFSTLIKQLAPELFRKAKERFRSEEPPQEPDAEEMQLLERISRLEKLLLEQEEVIRDQVAKNEQLEQKGEALQARLNLFVGITVVLVISSLVMIVMLMRQ